MKKLSNLEPGNTATVFSINTNEIITKRLESIGIIKGTIIKCLQKSPLGDPICYLIRGAVIALRCEDASKVRLEF